MSFPHTQTPEREMTKAILVHIDDLLEGREVSNVDRSAACGLYLIAGSTLSEEAKQMLLAKVKDEIPEIKVEDIRTTDDARKAYELAKHGFIVGFFHAVEEPQSTARRFSYLLQAVHH